MVDRTVLQCDLFKYNVTMAPTPITDYTVMLIRMIPARNRPWIADSFENIFNLEISFFKKNSETDAITEWKGGNGGSRATSIWVKPDSCCGSKPYNSGDKVNISLLTAALVSFSDHLRSQKSNFRF